MPRLAPRALAEIDRGITDIRNHGGDPDKVAFKTERRRVQRTLPELRKRLLDQKAEVSKQIDDAASSCTKDLKPFQDATERLGRSRRAA